MKRLALIAAVLAIAGCKTSNTKSDMTDSTAAAAPAMSADTGMKMAADTAAKPPTRTKSSISVVTNNTFK